MSTAPELPTASDLAGQLARLQATVLGEPERARLELQEILRTARLIQAGSQEVLALLELGRCAFLQGRYSEMLALAQEALALSQVGRFTNLETRALNSIGLAYHRQSLLDQAMQYFLSSLRLAQQILDKEAAARALSNIAMVHVNLREFDVALRLHEQALEVAQASGHAVYTANLLVSLMEDHLGLGNYRRVLELGDEAVLFTRTHGLSRFECAARGTLGKTLVTLGRQQASLRTVRAGLRVARWAKDQEMVAQLRWTEGQSLMALGELSEAAWSLQEALQISQQIGNRDDELQTRQALVQLHQLQGETEQAAEQQRQYDELRHELFGPDATRRTRAAVHQFQQQLERAVSTNHPWNAELYELTRTLKRADTEMAHRSAHDALTGALNRPHLQARLQKLLDILAPQELMGVVVLNLDHLKTLNEVFGQTLVDALLAEVVSRVRSTLRDGDLIGRLGSDEFALVLDQLAQEEDLKPVMQKVLSALRRPFMIRDQQVHITASLGGVLAPRDGQSTEVLFGNADLALLRARELGRNNAQEFEPELSAAEQQRRALLYDLRSVGQRRELRLHYQAVYDIPERRLRGFEALVRWQHPRLGLLAPGEFIPLAEQSRMILDIGDWVLREACRQAAEWQLAELGMTMAVNVSALQFGQTDFVLGVRSALETYNLPGRVLVIELTETMVQTDQELSQKHLAALAELGVGVAMDDFGTGFSSLSLLHSMPFQSLKIDRSFLVDFYQGSPGFGRARMLIEVMINLARNMNMDVVAEGVEAAEQLDLLAEMNCNQAQGYYLSRPIPAAEAAVLLPPLPQLG